MHIFFFLVIKKKNPYLTQKENKNKNKGQNIHVYIARGILEIFGIKRAKLQGNRASLYNK
jgi:hypothetical protein